MERILKTINESERIVESGWQRHCREDDTPASEKEKAKTERPSPDKDCVSDCGQEETSLSVEDSFVAGGSSKCLRSDQDHESDWGQRDVSSGVEEDIAGRSTKTTCDTIRWSLRDHAAGTSFTTVANGHVDCEQEENGDKFRELAAELSLLWAEPDDSLQKEVRSTDLTKSGSEDMHLYSKDVVSAWDTQETSSWTFPMPSDQWVTAPEFHPAYCSSVGRAKSYAEAVDPFLPRTNAKVAMGVQPCPYNHLYNSELRLCPYLHGELCQICYKTVLDIYDTDEKQKHIKVCSEQQERRKKRLIAVEKSRNLSCSICLDFVKEKLQDKRFGILPNCDHCFCFTCIRQWRQATDVVTARLCPVCRVQSPFVCPSIHWFDTPEEKIAIFADHEKSLKKKPCVYFNYGKGHCWFGKKCLYLHELPGGTKLNETCSHRPLRLNAEGPVNHQDFLLWDFIAPNEDAENDVPTLPLEPAAFDCSSTDSDSSI